MISKPIEVKPLDNYKIFVKFEDGVNGEADLSGLKGKGVFEFWNEPGRFEEVYIDKETGAIAWNKNVEIDVNNIYLTIIGKSFDEWKKESLEYAPNK
jgi:hypothetical protein